MHCVVTAGPSYEPVDQVRRLTNCSTGSLGGELANHLLARGHQVTLFLGEQATWSGPCQVADVRRFGTGDQLAAHFAALVPASIDAVFHAAALGDFRPGKICRRGPAGQLEAIHAGKVSSREEGLWLELLPATKVIARLRGWFPQALLVGWKYEVDGTREDALAAGRRQLVSCSTNACVVNGPAFGPGYGLLTGPAELETCAGKPELFGALTRRLESRLGAGHQA